MSLKTGPSIDHTNLASFGSFLQTMNYAAKAEENVVYSLISPTMDLMKSLKFRK
jgi:hypothetical protein